MPAQGFQFLNAKLLFFSKKMQYYTVFNLYFFSFFQNKIVCFDFFF